MSERIVNISKHLEKHNIFEESNSNFSDELTKEEEERFQLLKMLPSKLDEESRLRIFKEVPSLVLKGASIQRAFLNAGETFQKGTNHLYFERLALEFSEHSDGGFSNFAVPLIFSPKGQMPYLDAFIVLGNPADAVRIANTHVKKGDLYGAAFLGDGVLSNKDNGMWQEQRRHLSDAFLPKTNLRRIFPKSLARAKYAVDQLLPGLIKDQTTPTEGVEINEFLLYEAMAQLQLTLLGDSEENMNKCNRALRAQFQKVLSPNDPEKDPGGQQGFDLALNRRREARNYIHSYSNGVLENGRHHIEDGTGAGPLMERLLDMCPFGKELPKVRRDATATFLFAGHDTTANLMTHFLYEMAAFPEWQAKVQKEVDAMFDLKDAENRDITYDDLSSLMAMKRCINETLRLWPSVPNGTFREIEFEDYIQGVNNQKVKLEPGMQVTIPTWLLHRNPALWGPTVHEFNPDREWKAEEDWEGQGLSGKNPASDRYCPFTFAPRDCMGKNFAQMEARVILSCILRRYNVSLGDATRGKDISEISVNPGTLGPKNGLFISLEPRGKSL